MYFPVAEIDVFPLYPAVCAFFIAFFCSMGGISGAFLLLPYQISVLGYVQPGVSATNHIFNILACPAGVWRFAREGRLLLPLTLFIALGTLPGVFIGALLRLTVLATLQKFLLFVALTLFYLGWRMLKIKKAGSKARPDSCKIIEVSLKGFSFSFGNAVYAVPSLPLLGISFCVGLIGGIYGIGGGAIMSPLLVAIFGLPVYAIAGACLFATFLTSLAGVIFYSLLAWLWQYPWAAPDWMLGCLLGLGGIFGMYCGAAMQKYIAPKYLRRGLLTLVFGLGGFYLLKGLGAI